MCLWSSFVGIAEITNISKWDIDNKNYWQRNNYNKVLPALLANNLKESQIVPCWSRMTFLIFCEPLTGLISWNCGYTALYRNMKHVTDLYHSPVTAQGHLKMTTWETLYKCTYLHSKCVISHSTLFAPLIHTHFRQGQLFVALSVLFPLRR